MITKEQLLQIANEFGTPVYVYDAEKIALQCNKLVTAFQSLPTRFFYACKALTNINILKYVSKQGLGIDCSSINEVKLALYAGIAKENILYTSNGIAFEEIEEAVALGVFVNIDSLSNLKKFAVKYGNTYPVGIRIRPNILAGGNLKISTGHEKSKFGIPIEQLAEVHQLCATTGLYINKIHLHTGSDIKDPEVFLQGVKVMVDLLPHFPNVTIIDLGGGFKVPYAPNQEETDVILIAKKLAAYLENSLPKNRAITLWFEPGKYIVSECGFLLTRVNVLKDTNTVHFVGVNSGLNHLIRPMFYDAYHHIENISNLSGEEKIYTITGNICETDTFATDRKLGEVRENDILAFYNAGAYGFEMASNYNSRYKPAEVLWLNQKAHLIRKADSFEDLLQHQISVSF